MEVFDYIRFIVAAILILAGIIVEFLAIIGVYRFKYILNRMHAAAIGDTLALDLILLGTIVISGFNFTSIKLLIVMLIFMFSSPVSSYLICKMEIETNDRVKDECEVIK